MEEKELTGGAAESVAEESSDAGSKESATRRPIATDGPATGQKQAGAAGGILPAQPGSGSGHGPNGSVTTPTDQPESPEARRARYRALVGGEFKDLYTADTQRIIDHRFKETRTLQETLEAHRPVLERVMERYQVGDLKALDAAFEAEQAREQADREEARRRELERQERWSKEAEETQGTYPQFDLEVESSDPLFLTLLESGVPMLRAYETVHLDLVKAQAAQAAEKRLADHIRARGSRPQENGASAQTAVATRKNVGQLTAAERAEFARRAARGETITFR